MPKAKRQSTATTPDPTRRISRLHLGRENEREWKRLRRALELSDGFALYLVSTAGVDVQDEVLRRVQASLPHRPLVVIDVQKAQRPVLPWLFKQTAGLPHGAVVTVRGLSRGDKALEPDFWNRFNERRNVWHMHNPQVHVWFVDGRIRRRIREDAPDLYSIRSPDFLFTPVLTGETSAAPSITHAPPWQRRADDLVAEAQLFGEETTATGRHLYARALAAAGQALRIEGRLDEAKEVLTMGLLVAEEVRSSELVAGYKLEYGLLARHLGRLAEAEELYTRAAVLFEEERDNLGLANTLRAQGNLARHLGRLAEAEELYRRAAALYEEVRDNLGLANTLRSQGDLARRLGRLAEAEELYKVARRKYQAEQEPTGLAYTCAELARVSQAKGDRPARVRYLLQAMEAALQSNAPPVVAYVDAVTEETGGKPRKTGRRVARPADKGRGDAKGS